MALVTRLKPYELERDSKHNEVECTYAVVENEEGRFLQIDTYGSANRQLKGKKSQSIRFSKEAVRQLKNIIDQFEF